MKKLSAALILTTVLLSLSGCSAQDRLNQLLNAGDPQIPQKEAEHPRVYMDELCGTIKDFIGNQLTLFADPTLYSFDVSQADLECQNGLIAGDQVNVIYEGQLEGADTSSVKVLKVVDPFHNKPSLEEKTVYGQVQNLTANSLTLKSQDGITAVYPITGTQQYYQNGIRSGAWVYLHYRGELKSLSQDSTQQDASHIKVISVSDVDPFKVPAPTPTPQTSNEKEQKKEQKLRAVIQGVSMNTLKVLPKNSKETLNIDMSSIPCRFSGGITEGSRVNLIYTGSLNGTTLEGMNLLGVTGEIPERLSSHSVSYCVSGEITGSTANTITILSDDGMSLTFLTDSAENLSSGGLLTGSRVKLTFNPAQSRETNVYPCLKIEDA